jgi:proteasome lid subunit RPN8/RPN11
MAPRSLASLVECRTDESDEIVVLDVSVERPQRPANDVRPVERIAVRIHGADTKAPDALALRDDFPIVPHLNMHREAKPRSLCLYDRPWEEIRPGWTAAGFLERIRWWLGQTARGQLHGEDQPLEPLMFSHGLDLVVSSRFGRPDGDALEIVRVVLVDGKDGRVLVADSERAPDRGGLTCAAMYIETPTRQHGVIQRTPTSIHELAELVDSTEFSLLDSLRTALRNLPDDLRCNRQRRRSLRPLLVIGLPKSRRGDGAVETVELKGFLCGGSIEAAGAAIGAWEVVGDELGRSLSIDPKQDGSDIGVIVVNVLRKLTWNRAALHSGYASRDSRNIAAVGVGALGSQVAMNLARSGFGKWTLIDDDAFMPHNTVRHLLEGGYAVGRNKAVCMSVYMNSLADDEAIAVAVPANYLTPGDHEERVGAAISSADLVLDMSASVAVSRAIAASDSSVRAASVFLSPSGNDVVLLAEDSKRSVRLNDLEMLYYAAVATNEALTGHLASPNDSARYGASCRDVSVRMDQPFVGTLAGIAASAVRAQFNDDAATIRVWRLDPSTLTVGSVEVTVEGGVAQNQHGWRVFVGADVLRDVTALRSKRLPNETGGILLGGIDFERRQIHIVIALPSPADSEEWPTMYIRGVKGLRQARDDIVDSSAGHLDYLGEWHSHPTGAATVPSEDDRKVFDWIADLTRPDGRPPVMLISGDDSARIFVDSISPECAEVQCPR